MARKIGVEIVGDSRQLERAFDRSARSAKQFQREIDKTSRSTRGFLTRSRRLPGGGVGLGGGIGVRVRP